VFPWPIIFKPEETKLKLLMEYESVTPKLYYQKKKANSVALVRKRTIPTERPQLVGEVSANFCDRGCRVVSATVPHGRILGFLVRKVVLSVESILLTTKQLQHGST
jgi:hypothetical protein